MEWPDRRGCGPLAHSLSPLRGLAAHQVTVQGITSQLSDFLHKRRVLGPAL